MITLKRVMKDSGIKWIGEIPEGWEMIKLGYCSRMIVPMRDKPTEFNGDIPWIRIEDFCGKYISSSKSEQNISRELIYKMNIKVYPIGTVLCSCSCTLGICAITKSELASNQTFIGVAPFETVSSSFLYYLMINSTERLQFLAEGALQAYLSRQDFEHLIMPMPLLAEQQFIANFLDRKCSLIDSTIEKQKTVIENLKFYKQSVITEAVTKGLDPTVKMKPSGIEWIGDIPEGWGTIKNKYCSYIKGRIGWQGLRTDEFIKEGPYLVTGTDFENGIVNWESCVHITMERYNEATPIQLKEKDLLITKDGSIGKLAIVKNKPKFASLMLLLTLSD